MLEFLSYLLAAAGGAALAGIVLRAGRARRAAAGPDLAKQLAELQRFRAIVDRCVDSIYVVDRETLKFVDATATASSRTGYSHDELMQMGPLDLLQVSREELIRSYNAAIAAGPQGNYFLKFYGPERTVADNEKAFLSMIDGLDSK